MPCMSPIPCAVTETQGYVFQLSQVQELALGHVLGPEVLSRVMMWAWSNNIRAGFWLYTCNTSNTWQFCFSLGSSAFHLTVLLFTLSLITVFVTHSFLQPNCSKVQFCGYFDAKFCYVCRYFQCPPKHGLFAPLPKVEKLATAGSEGKPSKSV